MQIKTKIDCYVPARLGSQRLKKKALLPFGDQPLIMAVLKQIRRSRLISSFCVNTESETIANIVREDGYDVFLRNEALAQDSTTTEEILSDYVQKNSSDYICVINPTNPFLTAATIDNFLLEFSAEGYDTAFSVTAHQKHFFMNNKPINFDWSGPHPRTQDVTPVYSLNWAIVMWRTRLVKEKITKRGDSLYLGKVGFIAVDHWECFDIDTAEDYAMALKILATVNHENY